MTELELLEQMKNAAKAVVDKDISDLPSILHGKDQAAAFYGVIRETFEETPLTGDSNLIAEIGLKIDEIIESKKIVHWVNNTDIHNQMLAEIEDHLFSIKGRHDIDLPMNKIDEILERVLEIAKKRDS